MNPGELKHVKEDLWRLEDDAEARVEARGDASSICGFDVEHHGTRYRMPVNDFAVPRLAAGKQRPIESMEEARDWERLFVGEIKAGRDPRSKPARKGTPADVQSVAAFLDAYLDRHLRPAGIRSIDTAAGRIKTLKAHFGDLPVKALEDASIINRFKSDSDYARRVEISTLHKVLAILRAAIRWGQAQTPPLIDKSPFHRFGVRLNTKAETVRDRAYRARRRSDSWMRRWR